MAPKRTIANLYSSKYHSGKKNKNTSKEGPHLLSDCFIKVFYKMTTCPRRPLLSEPKSGCLLLVGCRLNIDLFNYQSQWRLTNFNQYTNIQYKILKIIKYYWFDWFNELKYWFSFFALVMLNRYLTPYQHIIAYYYYMFFFYFYK